MTRKFQTPIFSPNNDDGSGVLDSATLDFFDSGSTTTRKDTFTDRTYATKHANPVVADGDGRFPEIWLTGEYRVILKEKDGTQVWDSDTFSMEDVPNQTSYELGTTAAARKHPGIVTGHLIKYNWIDSNRRVRSGGEVRFNGTTTIGKKGQWPAASNGIFHDDDGKEFELQGLRCSIKQFVGVADGATSDSTPMASMFAYMKDSEIIWSDRNEVIALNTAVALTLDGEDFNVQCENTQIKRTADIAAITIINTGTITSVSAVVASTARDLSEGAAVTTNVSKITAAGHGMVLGEVGKIFADDVIPNNSTASERVGEFFLVAEIDGNDIYTSGLLIETYTTAIKIVEPSDSKVSIKGLLFQDNALTISTDLALSVEGFKFPTIDVEARTLGGIAIISRSNFMADMKVIANDMNNEPAASGFGYAAYDLSGYQTSVEVIAGRTRHAYTTGVNDTGAGDDDWYNRGRTIRSRVTGVAHGGAGAFDTHPDAFEVTFYNCVDANTYRGKDTSGASFQTRGKRGMLLNCVSNGGHIGFDIKDDTHLDGCVYNGDDLALVGSNSAKITGDLTANGDIFSIIGGSSFDFDLYLKGTLTSTNNNSRILDAQGSVTGILRFDLDYSGATANALRVIDFESTGNDIRIKSSSVKADSTSFVNMLVGDGQDVTVTMLDQILFYGGLITIGASSGIGATSTLQNRARTGDINVFGLQIKTGAGGSSTGTLGLLDSGEAITNVRFEVTGSGDHTISDIVDGKYQGQVLNIMNRDTSVGSLTLDTAGGNMAIGTSVVLASSGEAQSLFWDGGAWQRAS